MYDFEERRVSRHNVLSSLRSDLRSCFPRHSVDLWAERFSPIFLLQHEHFISDRDVSMSSVPVFICVCLHRLFCCHIISLHASFDCGCFRFDVCGRPMLISRPITAVAGGTFVDVCGVAL